VHYISGCIVFISVKNVCATCLMWQNYVGHDATGSRAESRHLICSTVYQLLLASHVNMSSYIRNKMAKLVVCVARQDWPHNYQDFFTNIYIVRECVLLDCVIIIVCQSGRAMQSTCENIHPEEHCWALGVTIDMHIYTVSQKMFHLCFAITLTYVNTFWYVLAEMLPIK